MTDLREPTEQELETINEVRSILYDFINKAHKAILTVSTNEDSEFYSANAIACILIAAGARIAKQNAKQTLKREPSKEIFLECCEKQYDRS